MFFVKKSGLFLKQGALCTVSVFLIFNFTYLGVLTHPMDPPAYGFALGVNSIRKILKANQHRTVFCNIHNRTELK